MKALLDKLKIAAKLSLEIFFNLFPVQKDLVVFYSFNGQYNDNPRYISEQLHKLDPSVRIGWILNKNSWGMQPDYVIPIPHDSIKRTYYSCVAAAYVENYTGKRAFRKGKKLCPVLRLLKRKNQFNLSTCHGTPLKKIFNDIDGRPICKEGCFTTSDLLVSGNAHLSKIIRDGLCGNINIVHWGSPRNDILLNRNEELIQKIREKNGIRADEKILLYAPTFRDSPLDSGIRQMELLNVPELLETMSEKFGGKWRLALRMHPGVFDKLRERYGQDLERQDMLDANQFPEMAEYLLIADALITDYSSSMFDYCYLDRPCFLFAHDLENYSNNERGLYIKIEDLPFTFSTSYQQLLQNVRKYDVQARRERVDAFLRRIESCESGNAATKAAEAILQSLKK